MIYGAAGLSLLAQFGTDGAVKSFFVGWVISVVNLELLKRLGRLIFAAFEGQKPSAALYVLLLGKFMFWGAVIALFSKATWIEAVPFILGSLTLIIAGIGVGVKEYWYAWRT
jgi:hypothetical protein